MSLLQLSQKTIEKAEQLVKDNQVQQLDDNTFLVAGSSKNSQYEVTRTNDQFVCVKITAKNSPICMGWKHYRTCKHCKAVEFYLKGNKQ